MERHEMTAPTDEQMRVAIAKACGWNGIAPYHNNGPLWGKSPAGTLNALPDYLNSLDAMHEAEKALTRYQQSVTYSDNLMKIVGYHTFDSAHATARQRAEAFLRVVEPDMFL